MNPGDTFLIPDAIGTHLYFVLATLADDTLILCHFTTRRAHTDNTCVIRPGEHSFVVKDTVVRYSAAYQCSGDGLKALERTIVKRLECLSATLLKRVRQGALDSPETHDKIKALLK